MAKEIEIKLAANKNQISDTKQWFSDLSEQGLQWQQKQLVNTYFDTEHHKLRKAEIGLRVRRDGENYIQSVKSAARVVGGLYHCNESETSLPNANLNLEQVSDPYLQILIEESQLEDGAIRPLFRTDFVREQVNLTYSNIDGESIVEIALDQGVISHKEETVPICEVELELKEGHPSALFELCQQLIEKFELVLDSQSKAERGYKLCTNPNPYLRKLAVVPLTAKSASEGAFETIAHTGLEHWQHYIKLIKRQICVDNVLQLHSGLQFMQHLYSVFAPLIPRHSLIELREDWRGITKSFAPLLHIAEQINWLENGKSYGFDYPELEQLRQGLEVSLKREGEAFQTFLLTAEYNSKMLHFSRWLYLKEWRLELKESAKQRLAKEIFPFAIKQLQHQMLDITRHLSHKNEMADSDYLAYLKKLYRTLDIGRFFGSLFDTKKRSKFRQSWVDLVATIELFKQLDYIRCALKHEERIDDRLEQTEKDLMVALKDMRQQALEQNPYWN